MRKFAVVAIIFVPVYGSAASAQNLVASANEFRNFCSSCHGEDGM